MSVQYNDYVLSISLEQGWITEEQKVAVETALAKLPGASALDFLEEQQLLNEKQVKKFREAITESQSQNTVVDSPSATINEPSVPPQNCQNVDDYLRVAQQFQASDIHLGVGAPPLMRRFGVLQPIWPDALPLQPADTEKLVMNFLDETQKNRLREKGDCDFSYAPAHLGRFRTSIVKQRRGYDAVFRLINPHIRTMEELELPDQLKLLTQYTNGLVLVTGPMGSGKSTTLAALVQEVNRARHDHIITLEDPIEYAFSPINCHITQREIGNHSKSFATALRASLREDPDVIMVGEMRDLETISLAITASETGHLVFSTLHTANAARTLDRVLDVFPVDQQDQIRVMVSESLRGIISQQLIPRADGQGMVLALEILINTPAVAALIRDSKTFMLPGVIQTGKRQGMKLMDDSLMELLTAGLITPQEAFERADQKKIFYPYLQK
ncbi:MAG: PilT/PilU family type 4a pilus ATPase [Verrucomicrobiia bacterium]